ncbi:EAL domain-containing protein [Gallionella capsiferriformans]|uniref:Diguanylate phosphodiesterase n=1 Tax=Gallionella capsiferriformans (strain ES-2) TaxID=395494 RepID=D9SHC9_GALCS|nr:EAL domain-containing protein [Gallionella capsiferriformans]ADL55926.1 diguanylate phosphodiesterase [Gallionella capsiferriformans ES-2]
MPHQLAELKIMLRHNLFIDLDEYALMNTKQEGLVCNFLGMRLTSAFQPIFRSNGEVIGREALLRASLFEHGALTPNSAFDLAIEADKLVLFDRLVRSLHLLSYAANFDDRELIFLNVHPRLLTSVSDHGRTFEQILHYYSVPTSRVVIKIQHLAIESDARLTEAVNNYRSLGYKIAVDDFGAAHSGIAKIVNPHRRYESLVFNAELDQVLALRPDIVKLDSSVIQEAEQTISAATVIHGLVNIFHSIGASRHRRHRNDGATCPSTRYRS